MDRNHSCRVSTQWSALRKRPDRCGVGIDRPKDAAAAGTGAPAGGRFARGRAGDLLHSVHWLPVAGLAKRIPALLDGPRLFLCLAGHWQVAQDRQSLGPASAAKTRTKA